MTARRRPSRRSMLAVPAGIALAVAVAGCSASGSDAAAPGTSAGTAAPTGPVTGAADGSSIPESTTSTIVDTIGPKACKLLTTEQVAPLLGFEPFVVQGSSPNFLGGGYSSMCVYRHRDDPDRKGKVVRVFVFPPGTDLDLGRRVLEEPHNVVGLADATAGRAPEDSGSGPNTILVDRGTQGFSITVATGTDHTDADLVALAQPALANFLAQGGPAALDAQPTPA